MKRVSIPVEVLRAEVDYDPETGLFTWLRSGQGLHGGVGAPALNVVRVDGYLHGMIAGRRMLAHRAAWAHFHGEWPADEIDHINRVKTDNHIANLRPCTRAENAMNRKSQVGSSSFCGVSWHKGSGKWQARICHKGGWHALGYYTSEIEAARAYNAAALERFGEFASLNQISEDAT